MPTKGSEKSEPFVFVLDALTLDRTCYIEFASHDAARRENRSYGDTPMANSTHQRVFSSKLTDGSHVRQFDVHRSPAQGWSIREERDAEVVRQVTVEDWHRVEVAIRGFAVEAAQLTRRGWRTMH